MNVASVIANATGSAVLHMPSHSEKARALGRRADELADERPSTVERRPRARVTALRSR